MIVKALLVYGVMAALLTVATLELGRRASRRRLAPRRSESIAATVRSLP